MQKFIRNWSINRSDRVITPSHHLKAFLESIGIKKNIYVINNGVPINNKEKVFFENKIIQLLVVSRLVSQKNIDFIIKAVKLLTNHDVLLNIVGDGAELNNLKNVVKKNELNEKVNFIGKVNERKLEEYLEGSDIFIQASDYEGLPHSILEAANYELPILSTEVGGCSEFLNKGERGYIIPLPVLENEIANCITKIINNKKEAISKAKTAKNFLYQEYNFNTNAEIYNQNINEMVDN